MSHPTSTPTLTLVQHAEPLAVVRLPAGADVPVWAGGGTLVSVTATPTETSVVCGAGTVPAQARPAGPYTAFEVAGPLDLGLAGVLAGLLRPLVEAEVAVFTLATYDTDWVLVPVDRAGDAAQAWRRSGYAVRPATDSVQPGASS